MREHRDALRAERLIDEERVCLAALQGGQADAGEVDPGKPAAAGSWRIEVCTTGLRVVGFCSTWSDRREARYNRPTPKKVGAAAALSRLAA